MKLIFSTVFIFFTTLFFAVELNAATFIVTNTMDDGIGSLRYWVNQANLTFEEDAIVFDAQVFGTPKTITLTGGQINLTNSININGPGANLLTISGNNQSRIFFSNYGSSFFTIKNLTLTKGFAVNGGAFYITGALNLSNVIITDNKAMGSEASPAGFYAGLGGGVYSSGGLVITDSIISNNLASGDTVQIIHPTYGDYSTGGGGGGVFSTSHQTTIVNCTFIDNKAKGMSSPTPEAGKSGSLGGFAYGGAFYGIFSSKIFNSAFINNSAVGGNGGSILTATADTGSGGSAYGGAIYSSGTEILNSTFSNNSATGGNAGVTPNGSGNGVGGNSGGGGIRDIDLEIANATVVNNTVAGGNGRIGGAAAAGGIFGGGFQWKAYNSTVTGNRVIGGTGAQANGSGQGGGVFVVSGTGQPSYFQNNIVAENFAAAGTDVFGNYINAANNLIGVGEGATGIINSINGNLVGTAVSPSNPMLAPLDDNGGLTKTRALLPGSPAINAGNNTYAVNPVNSERLRFDQRGFQRIVPNGGTVDIGAFEFGASIVPASASPDLRDSSDTGLSQSDNITKASAPVFDILNVIPGARIELLRNNVVISSATAAPTFTSLSYFSVSLTDPNPPTDGNVQYTSRQIIDGVVSDISPALNVIFDNTAPTVTINQSTGQNDPAITLPTRFTVVFSEPVSDFNSQDVSLTGSTADVSGATIYITTTDYSTYTVEISNIRSPGQIVVNIPERAAYDPAINYSVSSTSTDGGVNFQPNIVEASVSGRIIRSSRVIRTSTTIILTDNFTGQVWTTRTNPFGYYRFNGLKIYQQIGSRFSIKINNKSFVYNAPQILTITGNRSNLNFTIQ